MSLLEQNRQRRQEEANHDKYFEDADRREDWWSGTPTGVPADTGVNEKGDPVAFRVPNTMGKSAHNRALELRGRAQMTTGPQSEKWQTLGDERLAQAREMLAKEATEGPGIVEPSIPGVPADSPESPAEAPEQLAMDGQAVLKAQGIVEPLAPTAPSTPPESE